MPSKHLKEQNEWFITCDGHPAEVKEHLETGEVPERTLTGLDPAYTTYFWLYRENHNMCYLYLKLKQEEPLSRD